MVIIRKQLDNKWTIDVDGKEREVRLDDSQLIVWRTLGAHPKGAVEITQSTQGDIEKVILLKTDEEVDFLEFDKRHVLFQKLAIGRFHEKVIG